MDIFKVELQICLMQYIPRTIENELLRLINHFPVLVLSGPKQSGKTTLCKQVLKDYYYFNLEDISLREQISLAPKAFILENKQGVIIDEVQRYPDLFSYIQVVVDAYPESNIILTGSNNFTIMEGITQSLAGRSASLTLLPFSINELKAFNTNIETNTLLLNGGYPAIWSKQIPVKDISSNYYTTYVERDVKQLINIKDMIKFQTFIRLCAGRVGTEFNASSLSNETGVSVHTIQEWLSVLEASYIVFRLPPFFKNIGKRLVKAPKLYFYDTALACFLLGITELEQLTVYPLRGALFENLVVLEFLKQRYNRGELANLFFYRDKSQREIDLIQEVGTNFFAYEIKSAQTAHKDFFKNLYYLKKNLGDSMVSSAVIYDGELEVNDPVHGMINVRSVYSHLEHRET